VFASIFIKKANVGLGTTESRWGMQAFLLTMVILGISLFIPLLLTSRSTWGNIVMWLSFAIALPALYVLMHFTVYFLSHASKNPLKTQLNALISTMNVTNTNIQSLKDEIRRDREYRDEQRRNETSFKQEENRLKDSEK
jgi:hypothetical protein